MATAYAQSTGDVLYNVIRVDIEELDATTEDVKVDGEKHTVKCDSEINITPEIDEGKKTVLRDSTSIIAQAKEEDLLVAMNLALTTVKFPIAVLPIVQGGTLRTDEIDKTKILGYDAPTMAEGATNKKYFKLTVYVENYEGTSRVNYAKVSFPKCKGKILGLEFKKEFFAPKFDIRATENTKLKKPVYSIDYIDSLPA